MSRKRNPYIPLFTHDIMSSAKCRRLSMRATGLYLWLFCLMNEKPQQGRWALSTNEDHPTWKNSLTYRALQNADKYGRLPMFATLMARKFLPWKSGEVLKALQELYRFKLIVVEDDAIIQPRMYNDNGFKLREDTMREYLADDPNDPSDDPEEDLADSYRETLKKGSKKRENKGTQKGTKKVPQKVQEIHAPASRAESENENNINNKKENNNSIGIIGGAGEKNSDNVKNTNNNPDDGDKGKKGGSKREESGGGATVPPDGQKRADGPKNGSEGDSDSSITTIDGRPIDTGETEGPLFSEFWDAYDKKVNMIEAETIWGVLSVKDREAIMAYVPQYKLAQPRKQFRKNPVTFLRNRAWEDELIHENEPINNKGYNNEGSTDNRRGAARGSGRNQEQEAADMREQTYKLINNIRAERAAAEASGTDTDDTPF